MMYSNKFSLGASLEVPMGSSEKSLAEVRAIHALETDAELVVAFIGGNGESFAALVDRHMPMVYKFVYRYANNSDAANDITQEVFIKVWKNIKKFDQTKNFKTWLLTIAKNTALDSLKKKQSVLFSKIEEGENDLDTFLAPYLDGPELPDVSLEKQYTKASLERVLQQLTPSYRTVLLLRYTENMKFREIADALQEPIDTIKSKHRRALILLRTLLSKNKEDIV